VAVKLTVIGSANTDMVVRVPDLPGPGATVLGGEFMMAHGGKGANQAVAAARLGAEVTFVARLGRDAFGQAAALQYESEGLRLEHLAWDDTEASGVALIMVNERGDNMIAVASGANRRLSPADVERAAPAIESSDGIVLQLEIPLDSVEAAAKIARQRGVRVILNPAPAVALPDSLLSLVDVLTPNQSEAAVLAGMAVGSVAEAEAAAQELRSRYATTVVVTLGSFGALVAGAAGCQHVPAFQVSAVDTTAGGDAFNAGLAVGLAEGARLLDAVRFANAAGGLASTRPGAQPSLPRRAEVDALLTASR
jgi:ribokinase